MIDKQNAEHYQWGQGCDGWHLVKTPNLSIIQESVPAGAKEQRHFHQQAEQFFFVLSGSAVLEVAGQTFVLGKEQGMHVPAGVVHQLRNESSQVVEFIVTSSPPSHGDRVEL